jgi:hypothetical protein
MDARDEQTRRNWQQLTDRLFVIAVVREGPNRLPTVVGSGVCDLDVSQRDRCAAA